VEKDWRIDFAEGLRGQPLRHQLWRRWSDKWDHDHCTACNAEFAEFDGPDIQKVGFATTESYKHGAQYDWICEKCFAELKQELGWYEVE
jgi:hypothetical protein